MNTALNGTFQGVTQPPATHKAIAALYPLSPMQQGMLFHSLYAPNSGAYEVQICYELVGPCNRSAFDQAWQALIERHVLLRTAFVWENLPQPLQVVGRQVQWTVTAIDWSDENWAPLSEADRQHRLMDWLQSLPTTRFVLTTAPLMRVMLITLAPDWHWVVWRYHHLLLDGWSVPILLREFVEFYQAACQNRSVAIAPAIPYSHYIRWLSQQNQVEAEQFWRRKLQGFLAPTPLALPRPVQTPVAEGQPVPAYAELDLHLSQVETQQLQQWAKQHQLTLNTLVQAAWALLLNRYSGGESDVAFGVVCAGRPATLVGADSMVGLFVNTMPLRIEVSPGQVLEPWLHQLQAEQLELQQYAYPSLMDVQRWSEVPHPLPLFETLVIFENYPVETAVTQLQSNTGLAGLQIRNVHSREQTNYPLTLYAIAEQNLSLKLLYDCDRFTAATIHQLLEYLQVVLQAMMQSAPANLRLGELPWLTPAAQHQLALWNETATDLLPDLIPHLIEQQAQQIPHAIALSQVGSHLTYAQLNQHANQLAHRLLELNLAPEVCIGIYLERSPQLVIALLAVLKIGATYLPLDPAYPAERLAWMLENAAAKVILTQTQLAAELPGHIPAIALDSALEHNHIQTQSTQNPAIAIHPDQLAYVIYTSGSTGTPKGVQVRHQGLLNIITDLQQRLAIQPSDTLLATTTIAFDIAALELFLPLIAGARLWLGSRDLALAPTRLATTLEQHAITLMQATPTTWRMLLHHGWQGKPDLQILCGGEALDRPLAEALLTKGAAVWNLYGPTETTIWSAVYHVVSTTGSVPIGRPLANTEFWVLNPLGYPVPPGVPGELSIGGVGVARGYRDRPDLTADRFVPLSHSPLPTPHSPLYKTGDRVRYLPDGTLEYLGRLDYQIKLRGYRIELGEIEARLQHHPDIDKAVVVLHSDATTEPQLVAYLTPAAPPPAAMRQFLAACLPSYMIPTFWVGLSQLPLTPNGKVDRKALPPPESQRHTNAIVLPQTDLERSLAAIWQEILQIDAVGIDDHFFDLGGHSLRMVQLHSVLRDRFDTDLSLVDLFRYPTIRLLAEYFKQTTAPSSAATSFATQVETRTTQLTQGKHRLKQRLQKKSAPAPADSGDCQ